MALRSLSLLAFLAIPLPLAAAETQTRVPIQPSDESARANANHIFNAIHSAGRQWGSSLNHNGFGFIPVTVPAGTLFYHGTTQDRPPVIPEWLAFEVEHAEAFASSWLSGPGQPGRGRHRDSTTQKLLEAPHQDQEGNIRGYFHTYQTTREVQLLYVDGMSAGKTNMGTLDSQDLVLLENRTDTGDGFVGERYRAQTLCDMVTEWGFDGIMRMEIGFEVIFCDFSSGLQLDSAVRTFFADHKVGPPGQHLWSRAAGERFDGIGGDRVRMDFSSMVSSFFFPINISNTDPQRPDLIRLGAASLDELKDIKAYVRDACTQPRKFTVNWQAVVDMIVSRFSDRLASMASSSIPTKRFITELEGATLTYYDAPSLPGDVNLATVTEENRTAEAIERCATHYLKPALLSRDHWSPRDSLSHAAVGAVMQNICYKLFFMRSTIIEASQGSTASTYRIKVDESDKELEHAVNASRSLLQDLMEELAWTTWKKPRLCPDGSMLFVAMWPMGNDEDHWEPGCRSIDQIVQGRSNYWRRFGNRPRDGRDEDDD